jgi:hypothetical protein
MIWEATRRWSRIAPCHGEIPTVYTRADQRFTQSRQAALFGLLAGQ